MVGPLLTIYTSYDVFLHKKLPFEGRDDCSICVKIFSGVKFSLKSRLIPLRLINALL